MRQALTVAVVLMLGALASSEARSQMAGYPVSPGGTASWGPGAPTSPWVYYNPSGWAGYAPGIAPTAPAPGVAPAVVAPTYAAPVAPAATAWQGYTASVPTARPVVVYRNRNEVEWFGRMPGGAYREFGSGRPVPLAKPWLPGAR